MRSVSARIVAVTLGVALAAVLATAWVTNRATSQEVREAVVADAEDQAAIYETLSFVAFTSGSWENAEPVVEALAEDFDERIAITALNGELLVDSDPGEPLPAAPIGFIDPASPVITFDEPFVISGAIEGLVELDAIQAEATDLATILDEEGIDYVLVPDEFGIEFPAWDPDDSRADAVVERFYRERFGDVPADTLDELGAQIEALADSLDAAGVDYELFTDEFGFPILEWDTEDPVANSAIEEFYTEVEPFVIEQFSSVLAAEPAEPALLFLGYPAETVSVPSPIGWRLVLTVAGVAMLAVVAAVVASRRLASPIESVTSAAQAMESGDLNRRVDVRGNDEVAALASSFNSMAATLQDQDQLRKNMTSDVAHELRTPLSNVRGYLEAIQEGLTSASPETIDSLHEEALHLETLINDLQQLSLAEAGALRLQRTEIDLAIIVTQATDAQRARAEAAGVELSATAPDPVSAEVDAARIRQVVSNLLDNAIRHTAAGGTVAVALSTTTDTATIAVSDTGEGIEPEHLTRIFDRFYRPDASRSRHTGGSGLGLAIARELARLHNGDLTAESTPGQGSTFTITLPRYVG